MKKNSVLKAIVTTFLIYVVASWIIPGGKFSSGVFTNNGTSPVGISDLFIYPISTFMTSIFVLTGIIVLLIGGLYGVMNKTGVYQKFVEGVAKKFKGKEKSFLVISVLLFTVLASLTTLTLPLFVLVPFFVAVILTLGYNKMTALLSTVVAILVGNMGTIFGYNNGGYSYVNYFFGIKLTENIAFKIVLFVLLTAVLMFFVLRSSKIATVKKAKKATKTTAKKEEKSETKEEVVIPLYTKAKATKKSSTALVVIVALTVVVAIVGMYNWAGALGVQKTIFDTLHSNITGVKLNGYPIFANLLGSINALGYWSNYELAMLLVISTIIIGFVYNLKLSETVEAAKEGMKEMLPVAVVAVAASILLLVVNSAASTFIVTIVNALFKLTKGFNFATMTLAGIVGSIGYNDFPYLLNSLYDPINSLYVSNVKEIVFILQVIYGFTMMLVPASVGLVIGLEYLGISYKEWLKENWKLLLSLFAVAIILIVIVVLV